MKKFIGIISALALMSSANVALAKKPRHPLVNLMNVITVSAENGDFTSPVEAIESITDATDTNPYLIIIGPGVYDLGSTNLVMKEWVSIQGSGQEATKITGAVITGLRATVEGKNNTTLTDLTIENTGGGTESIAIRNNNASPRIERVTAIASGGVEFNIGIYNHGAFSPMITTFSPTITNVTASASGAAIHNVGVLIVSHSSPTMINVIASGSGGTYNWGVNSTDNASPFIQDSILEGEPFGIIISENSPGTRVVNSKIISGVYDDATGTQCRGNYDENLVDVDC